VIIYLLADIAAARIEAAVEAGAAQAGTTGVVAVAEAVV